MWGVVSVDVDLNLLKAVGCCGCGRAQGSDVRGRGRASPPHNWDASESETTSPFKTPIRWQSSTGGDKGPVHTPSQPFNPPPVVHRSCTRHTRLSRVDTTTISRCIDNSSTHRLLHVVLPLLPHCLKALWLSLTSSSPDSRLVLPTFVYHSSLGHASPILQEGGQEDQ